MDDPISALDADVKKKIFQEVFQNEFYKKTRILVTHAIEFLNLVDRILLIKDGQILLQGSYDELKDNEYFQKLQRIHKSHQQEQKNIRNKPTENGKSDQIPLAKVKPQVKYNPDIDGCKNPLTENSRHMKRSQIDGKIISDEDDEKIKVDWKVYKSFFMNYYGGCKFIILALTA